MFLIRIIIQIDLALSVRPYESWYANYADSWDSCAFLGKYV